VEDDEDYYYGNFHVRVAAVAVLKKLVCSARLGWYGLAAFGLCEKSCAQLCSGIGGKSRVFAKFFM
jgi:hypothetical protein